MKAQHLIAIMVRYNKWSDFLAATETELELKRLLFENQHKISQDDWEMYLSDVEIQNQLRFEKEDKLKIFKHVFLYVDGHVNDPGGYKLHPAS